MTTIAVAMLVEHSKKDAVTAAISTLTPSYGLGFSRKCCAIDPAATYHTPTTHWYMNDAAIDAGLVQAWQDAVASSQTGDPLYGLKIWTAQNSQNAVAWATANLESEGLQFVPPPQMGG